MAHEFFILSKRHSKNTGLFWRPEGAGYTSDLREAWRVGPEKAEQYDGKGDHDLAVPCVLAESKAQQSVNGDYLYSLIQEAKMPAKLAVAEAKQSAAVSDDARELKFLRKWREDVYSAIGADGFVAPEEVTLRIREAKADADRG